MARTEVFRVRVTADERAALDARAGALGVKPSALVRTGIRRMIAAPELMDGERKALQDGFRVLRGVSTNLNQIARRANEGMVGIEPEVRDGLVEVRDAVEGLRAAFGAYLLAARQRAVTLTEPGGEGDR